MDVDWRVLVHYIHQQLVIGDWLLRQAGEDLIGQLDFWIERLNGGHCCLGCLVLSHLSGKTNVTYICHITLFEINKLFFFVHEKFTGEIFSK